MERRSRKFKELWSFGAGLGNFPVAFDRFVGYATHFEGYGRGSHNIYLNVLVELGIVGFALLLNAFRNELRGRKFADLFPVSFRGGVRGCSLGHAYGRHVSRYFVEESVLAGLDIASSGDAVSEIISETPVAVLASDLRLLWIKRAISVGLWRRELN